jgi:Ca2+-binding EF-hand superfamily protein
MHGCLPSCVCIWTTVSLRASKRFRLRLWLLRVHRYDKDDSGTIDAWELRQVLESMGQKPTDEEIFNLISQVDEDMSQTIDFPEFLKVIQRQMGEAERARVR